MLEVSSMRSLEIGSISFDTRVTLKEAYLIMFEYLRKDYELGYQEGGEMGGMLGQLSLSYSAEGTQPMDGAVFPDFLEAAKTVLEAEQTSSGYRVADIKLKKPE
jgi:hypothetical protein